MSAFGAHHLWLLGNGGLDALRSKAVFRELAILLLFLYFTMRTESFFVKRVFDPLFRRVFGDGQELMDELNRKEQEMRDAAEQAKHMKKPEL